MTIISWAWWHTPVISATWEAKAGELLEPGRRRLQWAEITLLHSSLSNKSEVPSQKKKKKKDILLLILKMCSSKICMLKFTFFTFLMETYFERVEVTSVFDIVRRVCERKKKKTTPAPAPATFFRDCHSLAASWSWEAHKAWRQIPMNLLLIFL